jgi:tellurite resistance protein
MASTRRIPLNIFGIGFGLAGLATAWQIGVDQHLAPHEVSDVLVALAAIAWLASGLLYLNYVLTTRGALTSDLHDMTVGPFASLVVITPILLAADGIAPYSRATAAVIVDVFVVLVVLLGGWFTGTWIRGGTDLDRLHPGYFLPTVAGGLVASAGAAEVGQQHLSQLMFGLGILCWVIVGSMILGRLMFRPPLPDALTPTMAIEVAPAAVATVAYFFSHGLHVTAFITGVAGYGLLMVVAQAPLLRRYLRLSFSLGTWAFTFSWAAVASAALLWIAAGHPTGSRTFSYLVLAAISALVGGIAIRTGVAIARKRLLPALPGPPGPPGPLDVAAAAHP